MSDTSPCRPVSNTTSAALCSTAAGSSSYDLLDCLSTLHQRIWTLFHELASAKEAREARLLRLLEERSSVTQSKEHANALGGDDTLTRGDDGVWDARFAEARVAICAATPMLSELEACLRVLAASATREATTTPSPAVAEQRHASQHFDAQASGDARQQTTAFASQQSDDEEDGAHSCSCSSRSPHHPLRGGLHLYSGALIHPTSFRGKQTPRGPMELMDDSISFLAVESERETPAEQDASSKGTVVATSVCRPVGSGAVRQTGTLPSTSLGHTNEAAKKQSHIQSSNFTPRPGAPANGPGDTETSSKIQERSLTSKALTASSATSSRVEHKSPEEHRTHGMTPSSNWTPRPAAAVRETAHTIVANASPPNAKSSAMCSVLYHSANKLEHIPSAAELLQRRRGVRLGL